MGCNSCILREDEATVIWIADNITASNTHVGLVSSVGLPNPNLLILFSKLFTIFDSLISVSLFIAFLNITLIYFALKDKQNDYKNFLLFLLIGFSTYLSQHTIEPWGQSVLITVNSLFLYCLFRFAINKQFYLFPFISCNCNLAIWDLSCRFNKLCIVYNIFYNFYFVEYKKCKIFFY